MSTDAFGNYRADCFSIFATIPIVIGAGGGGTAVQEVYSGAGYPSITPDQDPALYMDTSNGALYYYFGGVWH